MERVLRLMQHGGALSERRREVCCDDHNHVDDVQAPLASLKQAYNRNDCMLVRRERNST